MSSSNKEGDDIQFNLDELISTREAAEISGLTQEHIALMLRKSEIWGMKIGRNWVTTKAAVREYLARDRRTGPKSKQDT